VARRILSGKEHKSVLGSDDLLCLRNVEFSVVIKQLAQHNSHQQSLDVKQHRQKWNEGLCQLWLLTNHWHDVPYLCRMWLLGLFCILHLQHLFRNSISIIFVFIIIIIIIPHCVSKNVPPLILTCYNLYIHGLTATIFGKNLAEKVDDQNVLYFPTSPNYCFCTTWGNKKPRNCVFSFKCCMSFYQKNTKHS